MIQNCEQCGLEYDAKRSDSRYCSKKCRVYAGRGATVTSATPISATPEVSSSVVILSDGQEFTPDVTLQPEIDRLYRGGGTVYQQQLATLSLQYDIIRGSDKAKEHAKRVMEGGAWC